MHKALSSITNTAMAPTKKQFEPGTAVGNGEKLLQLATP
jgi:hypothetical protein